MMLKKGAKKNTPPKCYGCGEIGHIKPMCPKLKNEKDKRAPKKQRAYISWENDGSGSEDSETEEVANLCLMAIEDGETSKENLHNREYHGHKKKVHSVAWNCIDTKLASGSVDQTARIWHINPHGHTAALEEALLNWLANYSPTKGATSGGKCSQQVELSGENINITYKPDGTHIAVGNREDELTILDVRKFKAIHKHKFNYEANASCPEVRHARQTPGSLNLNFTHLASLQAVDLHLIACGVLGEKRGPVRTISFNHTGELLASASLDLFIEISSVETGRPVHQILCRDAMNSVEWNPKLNLLAHAGDDKNKYQADEGVFRIFGFGVFRMCLSSSIIICNLSYTNNLDTAQTCK
ncbi:unnamed protein product [Cuscuta campestris]|uniref:CCHC-type domain-containing protein n=1 Tax=Cuscuta campestris TaxID=132261 RepID=A0A484MLT2_9ASTE|nr:unnamed protein product [Cuscuta campestris]